MDETYRTKAIILNRRPFGEDDTAVTIYTQDRGKLELIARGTKKIKSKLAGHLEPICLSEIMVVRGKQYDYIGSAISINCYFAIKNNLAKIEAAGEAIRFFNQTIKLDLADKDLFKLLAGFLETIDQNVLSESSYNLLKELFIFKLLIKLGYRPELYFCANCHNKILPQGNKLDSARGGLICPKCLTNFPTKSQLTISENTIKILRLAEKSDFRKLSNIRVNSNNIQEITTINRSFFNFHI